MSIVEGLAKIHILENVFYNPQARFNRSLGVSFLMGLSKLLGSDNLIVGDLMAASGIRGIRYLLESGVVDTVYFNDVSKVAYRCIEKNVSTNNLVKKSRIHSMNVTLFLSLYSDMPFDFIDIDPFGSPLEYISLFFANAKKKEGYVAFTATDMMTLCGVHLDALKRKYNVLAEKTDFCHEVAIRILLWNIFNAASKNEYAIEPLIATFENQYIRVYVKYVKRPSNIDLNSIGFLLLEDDGYKNISLTEVSSVFSARVIGPLWIKSYINPEVLNLVYSSSEKLYQIIPKEKSYIEVKRYLERMLRDDTSIPFIYRVSRICKALKCIQPPISYLIDELRSIGYSAYRTFLYPDGIRTNANLNVVRDLIVNYRD